MIKVYRPTHQTVLPHLLFWLSIKRHHKEVYPYNVHLWRISSRKLSNEGSNKDNKFIYVMLHGLRRYEVSFLYGGIICRNNIMTKRPRFFSAKLIIYLPAIVVTSGFSRTWLSLFTESVSCSIFDLLLTMDSCLNHINSHDDCRPYITVLQQGFLLIPLYKNSTQIINKKSCSCLRVKF